MVIYPGGGGRDKLRVERLSGDCIKWRRAGRRCQLSGEARESGSALPSEWEREGKRAGQRCHLSRKGKVKEPVRVTSPVENEKNLLLLTDLKRFGVIVANAAQIEDIKSALLV